MTRACAGRRCCPALALVALVVAVVSWLALVDLLSRRCRGSRWALDVALGSARMRRSAGGMMEFPLPPDGFEALFFNVARSRRHGCSSSLLKTPLRV